MAGACAPPSPGAASPVADDAPSPEPIIAPADWAWVGQPLRAGDHADDEAAPDVADLLADMPPADAIILAPDELAEYKGVATKSE